jgi:hypothetical protein
MSSEGGCVSARAGVDCQEGKFEKVKVGVEDGMLEEAEGEHRKYCLVAGITSTRRLSLFFGI